VSDQYTDHYRPAAALEEPIPDRKVNMNVIIIILTIIISITVSEMQSKKRHFIYTKQAQEVLSYKRCYINCCS